MSLAKQGEPPVRYGILPCLADGIGEELDCRLRKTDGWESEGVQSVHATAYKTEGNADCPHAKSEARQSWIIILEAHASR